MDQVMDAACKSYLERQCIPYAVNRARETILQMVQMRFVPRDEGEPHLAEDPTWAEDEEPSPCPIDTWARGALPLRCAPCSVERKTSPGKGLDPNDQESHDLQKGPHPTPGVLKAKSQVVRKPTLLPKAPKMAPGVSTWNPPPRSCLAVLKLNRRTKRAAPLVPSTRVPQNMGGTANKSQVPKYHHSPPGTCPILGPELRAVGILPTF
ncbi:uncharacterized protein LOC123619360 [Camelus bactrianus]|uniref:Uncharacterized protein LOC123619360 n=1 Tax=Camelus bactrianus TaxID=9837 RepID=A0AC58NIK1_CAMBA